MDLAPKLQFHPMPLPRPWPRRAHQNHCLVNVRSRWLRVVVFIVFFFAAMVMKSHILVQHITLGAFFNVESMWVLFPYTNVTMWTPCGLDRDSLRTLVHI